MYVHDRESKLVRPEKELKGFAKVALQPGETRSVSIPLDFRSFAYFSPDYKQWITEGGDFDLLIGASAADIRYRVTVSLESTLNLPCLLDIESTLREWMADPRGKQVLGEMYAQIEADIRRVFGAEERYGDAKAGGESAMGMDIMDMMLDMPLVNVFSFQRRTLPMHPEEMAAGLLQQVRRLSS